MSELREKNRVPFGYFGLIEVVAQFVRNCMDALLGINMILQGSHRIHSNRFLWRLTWLACSMFILGGCSKAIDFYEEVLLSDGAKVEIHRSEHLRRSCEAFSCGWALDRSEIRIDGTRNPTWSKRLSPLLLDKYQGKYFLIATVIYCDDKEFGRPDPDYIQFELTPSGWERRELGTYIYGRPANLLIAPNWYAGEPKKIDIATKETRNGLASVRNYKKVLARVTPSNC